MRQEGMNAARDKAALSRHEGCGCCLLYMGGPTHCGAAVVVSAECLVLNLGIQSGEHVTPRENTTSIGQDSTTPPRHRVALVAAPTRPQASLLSYLRMGSNRQE